MVLLTAISNSLDSANAKLTALVNLVKRTNSGTQLIDGIGTQMHLSAGGAGGAQAALQLAASAGPNIEVAITELDIVNAVSTSSHAFIFHTYVESC